MSLKSIVSLAMLIIFFSMNSHASMLDDLLNSKGPLGQTARQIWNSHQSSGHMGGIAKAMTEDECYERLDDIYNGWFSDVQKGETYNSIYSLTKIKKENIYGDMDINIIPNKSFYVGLTNNTGIKINSYSPATAIHLAGGCHHYLVIKDSKIENIDMNYPQYEDGVRTNKIKTKRRECRITNVSIADLSYDIIACIGDHSIYTRY